MSFDKYLEKIKGDYRQAVKVEWLNYDETVNFEFTNALYDVNASVDVNHQNGARRSCTLVLNNDNNKFPIDYNNIWIGQKFKLWMGVYLDDETPYYLPQGVFYVSNPSDTYNPSTRTVTINGVDKWAWIDGKLNGVLSGTYQTNVDTNLYEATRKILSMPNRPLRNDIINSNNIYDYFDVKGISFDPEEEDPYFVWSNDGFRSKNLNPKSRAEATLTAKQDMNLVFDYSYYSDSSIARNSLQLDVNGITVVDVSVNKQRISEDALYVGEIKAGEKLHVKAVQGNALGSPGFSISNIKISTSAPIDPQPPFLSSHYMDKLTTITYLDEETGEKTEKKQSVLLCPYTATVERGKTIADVLTEYATILCANIYYDVHGRLTIEPMIKTADDITDTNKEIVWDYSTEDRTFLGINQTYNFDKVYNDFIVLGNVLNGYQFKGRVQNRNPLSNTCVQKIGLKTKPPIEDNQYVSDEQCIKLAKYHAKTDTIIQKGATISSTPLYHLDVNKIVSVSTPNNGMSKELFLVTGFSLSSGATMSVNVTSINVLKGFQVVEATANG